MIVGVKVVTFFKILLFQMASEIRNISRILIDFFYLSFNKFSKEKLHTLTLVVLITDLFSDVFS